MRFALDEQQEELRAVVREFLADFSPEPAVRHLMAADEQYDSPMWTKMCGELGLAGLVVPEEYGGVGGAFVELGVVLEELGRALAVTPFLASAVMATTLLLALDDDTANGDYLPGLADGLRIGTVALAEDDGHWTCGSVTTRARHTGSGWVLDGHKSFVLDLMSADLVLVVARVGSDIGVFAVEPGAEGLDRQPLPALDQTRKQGRLTCRGTPARLIGGVERAAAAVDRMLDLTAIAVSAEMLGGAQRTLEMAVSYAGVREQFGRPIGSFQAIKHKCATVLVEVEASRSAVYYALWAAATNAPDLAATASLTKAFCSDAYLLAAAENIQIHGGIGYTWEHPAHLYLKRAKNSALFLGGPVGDRVVVHAGQWDPEDPWVSGGGDPGLAASFRVWGYDSCWGSFAQFCKVQAHQCLPKADHLTWEEAAAPTLTGATAYRMLHGWPPNTVQPGDVVLVWGGSGGLGSLAIQLVTLAGGRAVAVVSSQEKGEYTKGLGAVGYINRKDFSHWGVPPRWNDPEWKTWFEGAKAFGKAIWEVLGEKTSPRIVFEHPGEDTIPTSNFVCDRGGMIVICAGTTGYDTVIDVRYLWYMQKRYQGSHLFNDEQAAAFNDLVRERKVTTTLGHTYEYPESGLVHQLMADGKLPEGNVAVLINAPKGGLRDL